ncbi:MAG TPA: glycosyltransferase, partial [Blastocatellia bacterium]|nr:glycosyltransferase [Blastocatellia bacterium]
VSHECANPATARKVLVTLGGGDADNVTLKVVRALGLLQAGRIEARVLLGPASPHAEVLNREMSRAGCPAVLLRSVEGMPEQMAWADLAISAGGSTCWELAFLGVPCILIVLAQNQRPIAESLAERGSVINLGWHDRVSVDTLAGRIDELLLNAGLRAQMRRSGMEMVDGLGARRVALFLCNG